MLWGGIEQRDTCFQTKVDVVHIIFHPHYQCIRTIFNEQGTYVDYLEEHSQDKYYRVFTWFLLPYLLHVNCVDEVK